VKSQLNKLPIVSSRGRTTHSRAVSAAQISFHYDIRPDNAGQTDGTAFL
jgi:hypothetical protein